jgi:hypothetical protein
MVVNIQWQPPLVLEERKQVQWEKIIRYELGDLDDPLDVHLKFEQESLRWKVEALPSRPAAAGAPPAARTRDRVVGALRAHGKPVV